MPYEACAIKPGRLTVCFRMSAIADDTPPLCRSQSFRATSFREANHVLAEAG